MEGGKKKKQRKLIWQQSSLPIERSSFIAMRRFSSLLMPEPSCLFRPHSWQRMFQKERACTVALESAGQEAQPSWSCQNSDQSKLEGSGKILSPTEEELRIWLLYFSPQRARTQWPGAWAAGSGDGEVCVDHSQALESFPACSLIQRAEGGADVCVCVCVGLCSA